MRAAFLWGILLLADATYCTEEPEKIQQNKLDIPVWSPDWWPPSHPEWIPWPPQIPERNEAVLGTPAAIEEFPGLVQIENGFGPFWAQSCVGSILTSRNVLTVARCVSGRFYNDRFRRIRAGSSTRNADGVVIDFESVLVHPSFGIFQEDFYDGDIAIVRLRSLLTFGPSIQQATIIAAGFNMPSGVPIILPGWGSTVKGDVRVNNDLYKVDLRSVDDASCSNTWSALLPLNVFKITSNMICIAQETGGRNIDLRDLGAPVIYNNIILGIMSWGNTRGNQRFPAVATSVSRYSQWVVENAV